MPELNESDLHKLFHAAGHSAPHANLADRIMARVSVTPMERPTVVEALISVKGWIAAAVLFTFVIFLLAVYGAQGTGAPHPSSTYLSELFNRFALPAGHWPLWMAGVAVCLLSLAILDRSLERRSEALRR